jgi:hypothetical protein
MDKCQSMVERAYASYGDMVSHDGSMCRVDIEPHVMSRDRCIMAAVTKVENEIQSQS